MWWTKKMTDNKIFKGHKLIKKGKTLIIRDDVEDIIIIGKVLDIIPRTKKKKTNSLSRKVLGIKF